MFKLPPALIATCIAATSIYAAAPENQLLDEGIEALKARGVEVIHILDEKKTEPHPFTSAAQIVNGDLSYRPRSRR